MRRFITYLLPVFFLAGIPGTGSGQIIGNYSIGFTSTLVVNSTTVQTNTHPLIITQSSKCINLDNGLSKFLGSQNGVFNVSCVVDPSVPFKFILYPNPVISNYVIVKMTSQASATGNILIRLCSLEGRIIQSQKATITELKNGLRISLQGLHLGTYIVNLSSETLELNDAKTIFIQK